MKIYKNLLSIICLSMLFIGCSEKDYDEHSDINIPVPVLKEVPEQGNVGAEITIVGENFTAPNYIMLGETPLTVVSETATSIVVKLPRVFSRSNITVENVYERISEEKFSIAPIYPDKEAIKVTEWPTEIPKGQSFVIKGENVDLITDITVAGQTFKIDAAVQEPGKITVVMPGKLEGTSSKIVAKTILNTYMESPLLPITEFNGEIVLCDFEDGDLLTSLGDMTGINYTLQSNREGITAPQGNKFFSFYAESNNVIGYWMYLGSITIRKSVDLSMFNDPHLTFRYNSGDNVSNFQVGALQGTAKPAGDFKSALTGNELDNAMLRPTYGEWQWISVRLVDFLVGAWNANDTTPFDPKGTIQGFDFILKPFLASWWTGTEIGTSEVNKAFKINLDQISITDGPRTDDNQ